MAGSLTPRQASGSKYDVVVGSLVLWSLKVRHDVPAWSVRSCSTSRVLLRRPAHVPRCCHRLVRSSDSASEPHVPAQGSSWHRMHVAASCQRECSATMPKVIFVRDVPCSNSTLSATTGLSALRDSACPRQFRLFSRPLMAMHEQAGLFDQMEEAAGFGGGSGKRQRTSGTGERRTSLKKYDTVAAQLLNPYGPSPLESMSLEELWKGAASGSKAAFFHTELAATGATGGDYRVGIGLSRLAQTLLAALSKLREPNMAKLLQPRPLELALNEALQLEPHLKVLNAGKGNLATPEDANTGPTGFARSWKAASASGPPTPAHTKEAIEAAAAAVHVWLAKPASPLRAIISVLSAGGSFYAANAAEKTARAWIKCKPAGEAACINAALARATGTEAPVDAGVPDDSNGLFAP